MLHVLSLLLLLLATAALAADSDPTNSPLDLARRVVGGTKVKGSTVFPYMASVRATGKGKVGFGCGAVVLSATKVLTAGHCLQAFGPKAALQVRVGSDRSAWGGTKVAVKEWKTHPKYWEAKAPDTLGIDYDVGVMTLATPLTFSKTIRPATLVPVNTPLEHDQQITVMGFGKKGAKGVGKDSAKLRHATITLVDQDVCAKRWRAGKEDKADITDRMFCASDWDAGSCKGDTGSPVVDPKTRVLLGLTSWGTTPCTGHLEPMVYVNLANIEIQEWIKSEL